MNPTPPSPASPGVNGLSTAALQWLLLLRAVQRNQDKIQALQVAEENLVQKQLLRGQESLILWAQMTAADWAILNPTDESV